jgi:DHA2 family multidrug resistance protein-like MFS transporter
VAIVASAPRERSGSAGAIQGTSRLLGQTIGSAAVALVFGYASPAGGSSSTVAILLAAGFSALAALASLCRLLNILRIPRSRRRRDPDLSTTAPSDMRVDSPAD